MSLQTDLTLDDIFKGVGNYLVGVLPAGTEVVQGQVNRVPEFKSVNGVAMTPLFRQRLSLNVQTWEPGAVDPTDVDYLSPGAMTLQCDVFGPAAANNAVVIEATWRSEYGIEALALYGDMSPLYIEDFHQTAFIDEGQQYQDRWSLDLVLQVNQRVTIPTQFANQLTAGIISVDATYPPE